ncbi:hypothetical protein ACINWC323_1795 [Acinetobacter sp. WC-323]|uniref:LPO_1073/Vpar_1526 family protein n=1 Tax=Acinetobacter sp. WC-323 TaxID=903918 RepID=UPI00029EB442|nr:LPO_1073/Vpar_1526 family protein [Acinetobacter sp. WC-323]EKU51551.1 hypothetical protein ACINWC323_1795 [Acinetobacter sp. WC-323]
MPNNQEQAVVGGSVALQADQIQDVIINNGVQITEIIPICNQLFEMNFPRLREEAAKIALENVQKFSLALQTSINENVETIVLEKLADPDIQFCLNQSLQLVARHGEKIKPELLINLIQKKLSEDTNDFENLICNQAINMLDKITIRHLHLILFVGVVDNILPRISLGHSALNVDDSFLIDIIKKIDRVFCDLYFKFDKSLELEYSDSKYLESLGILNFDNMPFSYSSFDILHSKLGNEILINGQKIKEAYLKKIVEENSEKYFECLNLYNKIFKHNHVSLSFIGDAIMKSYLNGQSLSI